MMVMGFTLRWMIKQALLQPPRYPTRMYLSTLSAFDFYFHAYDANTIRDGLILASRYVHDNGSYGIYVDEMETATSEHLIQIKGVRSNNNKYDGMFFDLEAGADTTVILKDSETSNN